MVEIYPTQPLYAGLAEGADEPGDDTTDTAATAPVRTTSAAGAKDRRALGDQG